MGRKLSLLLGTTVSTSILGGVTAAWYRNDLLEQRRQALAQEKEVLQRQVDLLNETITAEAKSQGKHLAELKRYHKVVDSLWTERLHRYHDACEAQRELLTQLPTAFSVVRGIRSHYNHMSNVLPSYFAYEHGASKLHDLAILISMVRNPLEGPKLVPTSPMPSTGGSITEGAQQQQGSQDDDTSTNDSSATDANHLAARPSMSKVVEEVEFMFHGEPLVSNVCLSLRLNSALREEPTSLEELSKTFQTAAANLRHYINEAELSHRKEQARQVQDHLKSEKHSSLLHRGAHTVLGKMYVDENPASLRNPLLEPPADGSEKDRLSLKRREGPAHLFNASDVKSAIDFCDQLTGQVERELAPEYRKSSNVQACLVALQSWQRAATSYLVQQQAHEALQAFSTVLEYSFIDPNAGTPQMAQ